MVAAADLLLTVADIVRLKRLGVADIPDVPVFATGQHHDDEYEFTADDLQAAVRNFAALSKGDRPLLPVSIGIGHERDQRWLSDTGLPAVGMVPDLWLDPGDGLLHCSFADIPELFAWALQLGVFINVSAELYPQPPRGCPGEGCTLRRVVLMGADQPAVKRLLRLPPVVWRDAQHRFAERRRISIRPGRAARPTAHGSYLTFSEVVMDRKALEDQLRALGFSDAELEALSALDDAAFQTFTLACLARAAGTGAGGDAAATAAAETPSREQMIADLVAAGEDPAKLEAMTDADLLALWTQKVGGSMSANAENKTVTTPTPTLPKEFSEAQRIAATAKQTADAAIAAARRAETAAARIIRSANETEVIKCCERALSERRVKPADIDPAATVPNEYHAGIEAANSPTVFKFGEKSLTAFDAWKSRLFAREPIHASLFSEKIGKGADASRYEDARKAAQARHAQRSQAASSETLSQRLGQLPSAALR